MKHRVRRILSLATVLTLGACALGTFAGCTTQHPEVKITYSFNGKDYTVKYTLSRNDAPKTVQHFIELADAGFYDGLCIHDYKENDALYSGGYKLVDGELEEVDYLTAVKQLEEEKGITFTQSVWMANEEKTPLYSVYGEFSDNGVVNEGSRDNRHSQGALVMYYTPKGSFNGDVVVERADGGKDNDGNSTQRVRYSTNSATSLFYTYLGSSSSSKDNAYCVFGKADTDDYENELEKGLFAAIKEYQDTLDEDTSFTDEITQTLNRYDPFEDVAKGDAVANFNTPIDKPIIIKSVKVTKY
ncbi:MAG: peptidylprolyl isomerase [Clostridia bacterium]|nr:peptidylprolyl isomerase [Clostridia bacterium]